MLFLFVCVVVGGLLDIRVGFYFVSDPKVAMYVQGTQIPLVNVAFDQIEDPHLDRVESFLNDSQITLALKDGQIHSFPVSSEHNRDQQFFASIVKQAKLPVERE